jgi:hypothetical protein
MVENDEKRIQERQAQQAQAEQQIKQSEIQQKAALEQAKLEQENLLNQRDNETRVIVAQIGAASRQAQANDGIQEPEYSQEAKDKLAEQMREFDARLALDRDRLAFDKDKADEDASLKRAALKKKTVTSNK